MNNNTKNPASNSNPSRLKREKKHAKKIFPEAIHFRVYDASDTEKPELEGFVLAVYGSV